MPHFNPSNTIVKLSRRLSEVDLGVGVRRTFRIPDMFTGIFTLGFVGFIVNFAFLKIEQHFWPWRGTSVET